MSKYYLMTEKLTTGASVSISLCTEEGKGRYYLLENTRSKAKKEFATSKALFEYLERVLDVDPDQAEAEEAVDAYQRADLTEAWERCLENPTPENESELLRVAFETGTKARERAESQYPDTQRLFNWVQDNGLADEYNAFCYAQTEYKPIPILLEMFYDSKGGKA